MITAIETRYKGYRFRSRLEARWAVFFDALGVIWEYEKEGFEVPSSFMCDMLYEVVGQIMDFNLTYEKLSLAELADSLGSYEEQLGGSFRYLPDFWFPDFKMWGEVKGTGGGDIVDLLKVFAFQRASGFRVALFHDLPSAFCWLDPCHDGHDMTFRKTKQQLERAKNIARSARFEHGETPRVRR